MAIEPVVPPAIGFELGVVTSEPVTPAALAQLRHALVLELQKCEILHAELVLEVLAE